MEGLYHVGHRAVGGDGFELPYLSNRPESAAFFGPGLVNARSIYYSFGAHFHGSAIALVPAPAPLRVEPRIFTDEDLGTSELNPHITPYPFSVLLPTAEYDNQCCSPSFVADPIGVVHGFSAGEAEPDGQGRIVYMNDEDLANPWAPEVVGVDWYSLGLEPDDPSVSIDETSGDLLLVYHVYPIPAGPATPAICGDPSPPVTWLNCDPLDYDSEVFYQRRSGTSWSPPENVSRDPANDDSAPSVSVDGLGQAHVAWRQNGYPGYLRYTARIGETWLEPATVGSGPSWEVDVDRQVVVDRRCGRVAALRLGPASTYIETAIDLPILPDLLPATREATAAPDIAVFPPATVNPGAPAVVLGDIVITDPGGDGLDTAIDQLVFHATSAVPADNVHALSSILDSAVLSWTDAQGGHVESGRVYDNRIVFGEFEQTLAAVANNGTLSFTLEVDVSAAAPTGFDLELRLDGAHDIRTSALSSSEFTCVEAPFVIGPVSIVP